MKNLREQIKKSLRKKLIKENLNLTCLATGDHPAFLFARKGEMGTIDEKLKTMLILFIGMVGNKHLL